MRQERLENVGGSGKHAVIWHFDSVKELAAHAPVQGGGSSSFTGESRLDTIRYSTKGNAALVPEAEKLLAEIQTANLEVPTSHWNPSVAGAFPLVPAFLANDPESMMALQAGSSDRAPIRIFVDLTSSAGVGLDQLKRRGLALLAFAMLVSQERPVELRAGTLLEHIENHHCAAVLFNIETMPLELAMACHALTSQGVTRGLSFGIMKEGTGNWAWSQRPDDTYERLSRIAFGIGENDVYVAPMFLTDPFKNPVEWIKGQLDRFRTREG